MQTLCGAVSKNKPGRPNEDAMMTALGTLVVLANGSDMRAAELARAKLRLRCAQGHTFAVVDGVGSAPRGREAANAAVEALRRLYADPRPPAAPDGVSWLLNRAHEEITSWGLVPGSEQKQGAAAITVACFCPSRRVVVLHAGDTRAYRWQPGERALRRLTSDEAQGRTLSNYLGQTGALHLQEHAVDFDEQDWMVLVTDGVTKGLRDEQIAATLAVSGDPEQAATSLVAEAQRATARRQASDDATAVVIELLSWEGEAWEI